MSNSSSFEDLVHADDQQPERGKVSRKLLGMLAGLAFDIVTFKSLDGDL